MQIAGYVLSALTMDTTTIPTYVLEALLADDVPSGDLTTDTLAIGGKSARVVFAARQEMVVCASEEATRLFELSGARACLEKPSGARVGSGELVLTAEGSVSSLHRAWKTAQTLVEWTSGIASATAAIVEAAGDIPVACTRKNVPATKALSAKAVRSGGGIMHRLGLSETLLIFPEHRLFLDEAPASAILRLHRAQPEKKVVVEVCNTDDALVWAQAGADVLQLEKLTPDAIAACRAAIDRLGLMARPLIAVAGGVRADNAAAYGIAGADMLVTSAPYTALPKDVQVTFRNLT
jgi:molybdenum transport protein